MNITELPLDCQARRPPLSWALEKFSLFLRRGLVELDVDALPTNLSPRNGRDACFFAWRRGYRDAFRCRGVFAIKNLERISSGFGNGGHLVMGAAPRIQLDIRSNHP